MPHVHEQYDFVISVYISYQDRVLLVDHPRYAKWLPIGSHIELDEDPEQALYREIKEETGLEVEILSSKPQVKGAENKFILTPNYVDVHHANAPHQHIALVYFARSKNDAVILSEEHTGYKWFAKGELGDEMYSLEPAVQFYAREVLRVTA